MNKISQKLKDYEDFELAFLFEYCKTNYMPDTLKLIEDEIKLRRLTKIDLQKLIKRKLKIKIKEHKYEICPRCTSEIKYP